MNGQPPPARAAIALLPVFSRNATVSAIVNCAAEIRSPAASAASDAAAGERISSTQFTMALAIAFVLNTGSKAMAARAGGGWPFMRAVLPGLLLTVAGVAAPLAWSLLAR